ncbi:MFS transporter [Kitasatospora gansuensis]
MPLAKTRDDGGRGLRRAAVLANADWCVTTPLLPALAAGLGTGPGTVTLSVGLHSLGHACALPLWGRLVDRYGPQAAVRAGLLLAAVASAGSALATGAGPWLVLRVLAGAGFAALTPAIAARHAAVADPGARQRRFAGLTTATSVSAVLTPLLAGLAVAHGSWRLLFGALAVGAGLTVAGLRRGAPRARGRPAGARCRPGGGWCWASGCWRAPRWWRRRCCWSRPSVRGPGGPVRWW